MNIPIKVGYEMLRVGERWQYMNGENEGFIVEFLGIEANRAKVRCLQIVNGWRSCWKIGAEELTTIGFVYGWHKLEGQDASTPEIR
jgi:hypothetical protein